MGVCVEEESVVKNLSLCWRKYVRQGLLDGGQVVVWKRIVSRTIGKEAMTVEG